MRLRTFESFWLVSNGILNSYPSLHKADASADIVVIGGGITGALVSHALMEKNYKVILIDKRDIASGSTAATTCMLQYEIDVPLYKLSELIGEEDAVYCYREGITAIKKLGDLVESLKIDCGFEKKNSLYIAKSRAHARWLKTEFEIRNKHGLGVSWLQPDEVSETYGITCFGAILSDTAASADAYRLAHGLIAYNVSRGMKVFDQTSVRQYDVDGPQVKLITQAGGTLTCNKIIFCSGYEAAELLKEKPAELFYTYACVSERGIVLPPALEKTLVWDTGNPYLYMRATDDGRFLIGGQDSSNNISLFQNRIKEKKSRQLQEQLKKIASAIEFTEDFSWGGTFGTTKDGLPYIGKSPEFDKALFVLGYGGNGITFSVQAMQLITDLLENKENRLEKLYRFGR